jgi:uncharacterized Zn-finger protein
VNATKEIRDLYFDCLGKKRYTTRIRSAIGGMEMDCLAKAISHGHSPRVHLDSRTESFLSCLNCDMMGSITLDEGVSGSILEVQCGAQISTRDPESAWDQAQDPYTYYVPAQLFGDELPD